MKKIILGVFLAVTCISANAQIAAANNKGVGTFTNQVVTDNQIREMANKLQLNEGSYIKFRDLSRARREKIEEINSMYSNDPTMRQSKISGIDKDFESQLSQNLSQKQFQVYLTTQGSVTQNPGAGSSLQAEGYGGRSFETTGTPANAPKINSPSNDDVIVNEDMIKVKSINGDLKVTPKKEKISSNELEYKSDADESKIKSKDGTFKSKTEKGKSKIETPEGKLKIEGDKVKLKSGGKKIKL